MGKEIDLINAFFQRTDLSSIEAKLKLKCLEVKGNLDEAGTEVAARRSELIKKEEEVKALTYKLDGLIQFILELEVSRIDDLNK